MKRLAKNTERMFQCFFGAVYHCYEKYGHTDLAAYQLRQFNYSFKFPEDKTHRFTFGLNEIIVENEYFKMHYKNLDPKRQLYMTPQSELLIVEVELYQPMPSLQFASD